jgi:flagellar biogenesis protein FliO
MKNITRLLVKKRALRLILVAALALFFYIRAALPLLAASGDAVPQLPGLGDSLSGYVERMLLALTLFAAAAFAAAKFLPKFFKTGSGGRLRMIGAMSLGRDAVYIIQTGPDVMVLFVGKSGATLLGRWRLEEWEDYEASAGESAHESQRTKGSG